MKSIAILLMFVLAACGMKSTHTDTVDSVEANSPGTTTTKDVHEVIGQDLLTADSVLPESLRNDPLARYHGEYMLITEAAVEQARMTLTFQGNHAFDFAINFEVADFCSELTYGTFDVDDQGQGTYDNGNGRPLNFSFKDGEVTLSDSTRHLSVGVCQLSGRFVHCDGKCKPISWEGFDSDEDSTTTSIDH